MSAVDSTPNPHWKMTCFPSKGPIIPVAIMYTDDNGKREAWCESIKEELKLSHLSTKFSCGYPTVCMDKSELSRIYEVVQAFLNRGEHLRMNDNTQVTFKLKETPTAQLHETKFLTNLMEAQDTLGKLYPREPCDMRNPVHRSEFWTIPEGKRFAAGFRVRWNLKDETDIEGGYWPGEYWLDVAPKARAEPPLKEESKESAPVGSPENKKRKSETDLTSLKDAKKTKDSSASVN